LEAYPVILDNQEKKYTENSNTTTYWNAFFEKAIKELYTVDPNRLDLNNARVVSAETNINKFDSNNTEAAVSFFTNIGYSLEATSAIVGGLLQESGLKPDLTNSIGAYGIAQWLGNRKDKLKLKQNFNTLQTQLNYIAEELGSTEKAIGDKLKSAKNISEAVIAAAAYEKFKGYDTNSFIGNEWGNRYSYTLQIYNKYKK
jgi:hypothetical protein